MLLERMGETVTLEKPDGTTTDVERVLCYQADISDQTVQDVQTRFINQARYKGDQLTLNVIWPKDAPHDLMDSHMVIRGERYHVYGSPFAPSHSPVGYDLQVTCTRTMYLYDVELLTSTQTRDEWGVHHTTWTPTQAKANLLRLAEDTERGSGQEDVSRIIMFEFAPETWGEHGYEACRYLGHIYYLSAVARSDDSVVCTLTGGVTDE